jgi:hypothetical protein
MTKAQLIQKVQNGEGVFAVAEFRSSFAETINYSDRKTGRPMSAPVCAHTVEIGGRSVRISEFLPDTVKPEDYKQPFKKGQMVVIEVAQLVTEKGNTSGRGAMYPLEN